MSNFQRMLKTLVLVKILLVIASVSYADTYDRCHYLSGSKCISEVEEKFTKLDGVDRNYTNGTWQEFLNDAFPRIERIINGRYGTNFTLPEHTEYEWRYQIDKYSYFYNGLRGVARYLDRL